MQQKSKKKDAKKAGGVGNIHQQICHGGYDICRASFATPSTHDPPT